MRISDRYIGRQVLSGTLFAIVMLSLLLVLGNLFQKIRPLLVELGAPLSIVAEFTLNVLPVSLIYTVPWAFLSAVLLVFGRLSSDNELTGFRGAGLSLWRLSAPVFVIGLLLSGACLWLNLNVAPHAKKKVENIITRTVIKDPRALLSPGAAQSQIKNVKVFIERDEGNSLVNFHLFKPSDELSTTDAYVHAERVEPVVDEENQQFRLRLTNATIDTTTEEGDPLCLFAGQLEPLVFDYSEDYKKRTKPASMSNAEIDQFLAEHPNMKPEFQKAFRLEALRRYAISFACLAFAFVAVPLGIKTRRRDSSSGLVLSLAIGAGYFLAANSIADSSKHLMMIWAPNLACLIFGIFLFRRARFR